MCFMGFLKPENDIKQQIIFVVHDWVRELEFGQFSCT
jgi:hypothetical protein